MNITFIAPPAAGKGALSNLIYESFGFPHVSIGDLLRDVDDPIIKKELEEGAFVDNKIVSKLLDDRLSKDDCSNGFVLDGFPRNMSQISIYEDICKKSNLKNIIVVIDIPREIGKARITGRRVCSMCGSVYNVNISESKPKVSGICDKCGHKLDSRSDDNLDTYNHRYDVYVNETAPIIKYFGDKAYHVDGSESLERVFNNIKCIIEENL